MKSKEEVIRALQLAQLTSHIPELEPHIVLSIRLLSECIDETKISTGETKLGGLPDLPPTMAWPLWKQIPMAFVAQINLAQVGKVDPMHRLPAKELLYFFYDSNQQDGESQTTTPGQWQVLFYAGDSASLQRAAWPANLPAIARFSPCKLSMQTEYTLPLDLSAFGLSWSPVDKKRYSDFMTSFPSKGDSQQAHHRMFGHTDQIQDDMHTQVALESQGLKPAQLTDQLRQEALHWQLLLQIDTDAQAGMNWANNGRLYFWLNEPDLNAQRFDATWLVVQSE